jgi:AAA domain, putative AbiEii toxin, Type IV TA system
VVPLDPPRDQRWEPVAQAIKPFFDDETLCGLLPRGGKRVLIPVLRSAWSLFDRSSRAFTKNDIYEATMLEKYFKDLGASEDRQIYTGLQLYESMLHARDGSLMERLKFVEFQKFIKETFHPKASHFEIVARAGDTREISVTIDEEERKLHHLGDGEVGVILLLYPMFMAEHGTTFLIEEPENSLHPGYQRLFLETILTHNALKDLQVFCTTHSNHLVGIATERRDVGVFRVQKDLEGEGTRVSAIAGPAMHLLDDLGVTNNSVYLAKCSIWVEGVSDRLHLQGYLRAYFDKNANEPRLREGLDYAFVEFGGSNLAHYDFSDEECSDRTPEKIAAQFVANRVFLLTDFDDEEKQKDWAAFQQLSDEQGHFVYRHTRLREMENLVSKDLLESYLKQRRTFKGSPPQVVYEAYDPKGLGLYLTELTAKPFQENSKTPPATLSSYHKEMLRKHVRARATWENMSPDARELTADIVRFIRRQCGVHAPFPAPPASSASRRAG